ncbi:MAG: hypothetical protein ACRDDH_11800 [Cetobacterium sp.]|uniref:hypothetical protein n=1 Tax=Cetobacterium sp. TaxID=2071632 RepID=UPI003EE46AEE
MKLEYLNGIEDKMKWMRENSVHSIEFMAGNFCEERFVQLCQGIDGPEEWYRLMLDDEDIVAEAYDKKVFLEQIQRNEKNTLRCKKVLTNNWVDVIVMKDEASDKHVEIAQMLYPKARVVRKSEYEKERRENGQQRMGKRYTGQDRSL